MTETKANEVKPTARSFENCKPRKWKNKESGKLFKVLPWFQPMDNESRFDFKGMLKDVLPELGEDILQDFECYSGLLLQVGWMMENENRMWLGLMGMDMNQYFEDLGHWTDEDTKTREPILPEEGSSEGSVQSPVE